MGEYCDVCGHSGDDLKTAVEVCRDCYDYKHHACGALTSALEACVKELERIAGYSGSAGNWPLHEALTSARAALGALGLIEP